jgi:hypothetical protein
MMKNGKKITRVRLQVDASNDLILLGLVSSEPDYKLTLALNQSMGLSLKNSDPINILSEEENELQFSRFVYIDNITERSFTLISNRCGKYFLIKKLRNIDYIFQVHDAEGISDNIQLVSRLKSIASITAVFSVDYESINDKNLELLI